MHLSDDVNSYLNILLAAIPELTASLQGRSDYPSEKTVKALVEDLANLSLSVKTLQFNPQPDEDDLASLSKTLSKEILPEAGDLVDANIALINKSSKTTEPVMGPARAREQNALLKKLEQQVTDLLALLAFPTVAIVPDSDNEAAVQAKAALSAFEAISVGLEKGGS